MKARYLWLGGVLLLPLLVMAGEELGKIVSFDDSEVEVREGDDYSYLPVEAFDTPPIPIIDRDSNNFIKVKTRDGREVWVNSSYVTTDRARAVKKGCQSLAVAKQGGARQYGVRGVGEGCK